MRLASSAILYGHLSKECEKRHTDIRVHWRTILVSYVCIGANTLTSTMVQTYQQVCISANTLPYVHYISAQIFCHVYIAYCNWCKQFGMVMCTLYISVQTLWYAYIAYWCKHFGMCTLHIGANTLACVHCILVQTLWHVYTVYTVYWCKHFDMCAFVQIP